MGSDREHRRQLQIVRNAKKAAANFKPRKSTKSYDDPFLEKLQKISVDSLSNYSPFNFNGDKFYGGYGETTEKWVDYDELQIRSGELFRENIYARGLVRRLVTNEITTGLKLEAMPEESVLGLPEDSLEEWSEGVELRFSLYGNSKKVVDWKRQSTLWKIEEQVRMEAIIAGDVLVVLHEDKLTKAPSIEIVQGEFVRTPLVTDMNPTSNDIVNGVELDKEGRHVAYWVMQADGSSKRVAAFGSRTGRRISWLVYGSDKRAGEVRGQPLLSIILQSLKEIDRYRDSAQRKAVINSMIAMYIKKTEDKPGTKPISNGAVRKGTVTPNDSADSQARKFATGELIPGMVLETLQQGEEPVGFKADGTDVNFGPFEEVIIQAVAWCNEVPPEILRLAFSNNYSASQAAINEFKIYLNKKRAEFGADFCQPVYEEWLLSEVISNRIRSNAIFVAFNNKSDYLTYAAWVQADWSGAIKPATDLKKMAQGYKIMVDEGWITNGRSARELTGMKFTKVIKRLAKENALKAAAARPLLELQAEFGSTETDDALEALAARVDENLELIEEGQENG